MKKCVCICGSPRRDGNSQFSAEVVCTKLREAGMEVTFVNLVDCHIERCVGCRQCMRLMRCAIQDDDFQRIMDQVLAGDILLFSAPVYWNGPPGIMKDFIDRTHGYYARSGILRGKAAFLISVATESGFETHEKIMESWLVHYGADIQGRLRLFAREKNDVRDNPHQTARLEALAEEMARA